MYKALIVPCFDCFSCVWGYIGKVLSKKLQKLQNRAARMVIFSKLEKPCTKPLSCPVLIALAVYGDI